MVPCVSERRICTAYLAGRREKKATVSIRLGDESRNHSLRLQVQGRACFLEGTGHRCLPGRFDRTIARGANVTGRRSDRY